MFLWYWCKYGRVYVIGVTGEEITCVAESYTINTLRIHRRPGPVDVVEVKNYTTLKMVSVGTYLYSRAGGIGLKWTRVLASNFVFSGHWLFGYWKTSSNEQKAQLESGQWEPEDNLVKMPSLHQNRGLDVAARDEEYRLLVWGQLVWARRLEMHVVQPCKCPCKCKSVLTQRKVKES